MDQFDRAAEIESLHRKLAINRARSAKPSGESRTHCLECEEEIPEGRRLAMPGCEYCVTCQEEQSNKAR